MSNIYWVCAYAFERAEECIFVYGYATEAEGQTTGQWTRRNVTAGKSRYWRVQLYGTFLEEKELERWRNELQGGSVEMELRGGEKVTLMCPPLTARPPVYGFPHDHPDTSSTPKSLSDQLALIEALWQVNKEALFQRVLPPEQWTQADAVPIIRRVLETLREDTGIQFDRKEAGRFGNFEVVRYLFGDYRNGDGVSIATVKETNNNNKAHMIMSRGIEVHLAPPIAEATRLTIGCRLYNGLNTLLIDQISSWSGTKKGPEDKVLFMADEPISAYEVNIWNEEGTLVAHEKHYLMRSIEIGMNIHGQQKRVMGPWLNMLPEHLKERASIVPSSREETIRIGDNLEDPWVEAERTVEAWIHNWCGEGGRGQGDDRWFRNGVDGQVEALEAIRSLCSRREIQRIVIYDPYFGPHSIDFLLARLGPVAPITIVTSCVEGIDPDENVSRDGAAADPSNELANMCERNRETLPQKCRIISVENAMRSDRQFHDRYVKLVTEHGVEVWSLSNSLNSAARRYPLLLTKVSPTATIELDAYLLALENGNLAAWGKKDARSVVIWEQQTVRARTLPEHPVDEEGRQIFPGCEWVSEAVRRIGGKFVRNDSISSWRLCDGDEGNVAVSIMRELITVAPTLVEAMRAGAWWAYYGGPNVENYSLGNDKAEACTELLEHWLVETKKEMMWAATFEPLKERQTMRDALGRVYTLLQFPDSWSRYRYDAVGRWCVSMLWMVRPTVIINMIVTSRSMPLLTLLLEELYWDCDEEHIRILISSDEGVLRSLGACLSWKKGSEYFVELSRSVGWSAGDILYNLIGLPLIDYAGDIREFQNYGEIDPELWKGACSSEKFFYSDLVRLMKSESRGAHVYTMRRLADVCPLKEVKMSLLEDIIRTTVEPLMESRPQCAVPAIYNWPKEAEIFAISMWQQHQDNAGMLYVHNCLEHLPLGPWSKPLLRSSNYQLWSMLAGHILFGLVLGIAIVEYAPDEERRKIAKAALALRFQKLWSQRLLPEIRKYGDFYGLLPVIENFVTHEKKGH